METLETSLDRAYHAIMRRMVASGRAPHYIELASELHVSPDEGREILHQLFGVGVPGWLHPGTDLIASFAPFSNLPTQYDITIDDMRGWYGQ